MTALYEPGIVATFQMACGVGGVVCGFLALREHGRERPDAGGGRTPVNPWLMYCLGFLIGCMLAQVVRYVAEPSTVLGAIAVHASIVALLATVWAACHNYARLWTWRARSVNP